MPLDAMHPTYGRLEALGHTPETTRALTTYEYRCRNCDATTYLSCAGGRLNNGCDPPECNDPTEIEIHLILAGDRTYVGTFAEITGAFKPAPDAWKQGSETPSEHTHHAR